MADVEFTLTSNAKPIKEKTAEAIITALKAVGAQAQGHATAEITAVEAIDTGRLKNSITFAVSGDPAREYRYTDDDGKGYTDRIEGAGDEKDFTLYLGTNVEYATFVESGTGGDRNKGARPFIRPAVENWISEYQQVFQQELSKIGK
jgi:HK97 gp10 family phage protein